MIKFTCETHKVHPFTLQFSSQASTDAVSTVPQQFEHWNESEFSVAATV